MNKSTKLVLGLATAVLSTAFVSTSVLAWGDSNGGRDVYYLDQINAGVLGNNIVMNSIRDGSYGDERNFVAARDASQDKWEADEIIAEDGKEYILSLYVHNNNPNGEKAVAKDVTTRFSIPSTNDVKADVSGVLSVSNANPTKYWDNVIFKSKDGKKFHLEVISGTGLLENNGIGKNGGAKLSDELVKNGVKIGYTALDGNVPGCYQYDNYVSVKVKAVYEKQEEPTVDFTVDKKVRLAGTKDWQESVDAKIGDTVEFQITYKNTSSATQSGVMLKDSLPENLSYIKESTKVYNAAYPQGLAYEDSLGTSGINLGSYTAGSNAIVRFSAKVVDSKLSCGANTMKNIAQVFVNNTEKRDDASVKTTKTCSTDPVNPVNPVNPQKLPDTGVTGIVSGALGAGSIVTSLGYFIASRKNRF